MTVEKNALKCPIYIYLQVKLSIQILTLPSHRGPNLFKIYCISSMALWFLKIWISNIHVLWICVMGQIYPRAFIWTNLPKCIGLNKCTPGHLFGKLHFSLSEDHHMTTYIHDPLFLQIIFQIISHSFPYEKLMIWRKKLYYLRLLNVYQNE